MDSAMQGWIASLGERVSSVLEAGHPIGVLVDELGASVHWSGCPAAGQLWSPGDGYRRMAAGGCEGRWWAALIAWPPGHATPIHDHDGLWGVEVVLDGVIEVEAFSLDGEVPVPDPGASRVLGRGDAGMFEGAGYAHRCRNLSNRQPALSLHVYGGELGCYRGFERDERGRWTSVECRVGCSRVGGGTNG